MNERILNELYKQAHIPHTRIDPTNNMPYESTIFSADKFAELVIKECGVALAPMLRDMISRGQAFDLIKKHFGVEQ